MEYFFNISVKIELFEIYILFQLKVSLNTQPASPPSGVQKLCVVIIFFTSARALYKLHEINFSVLKAVLLLTNRKNPL